MFWQTRNYNTSENDCQQRKSSCPVVVVKIKKEIGFLILTSLRGYQHSFSAEASYLLSNKTTIYGWTLDVSRSASNEITLARLSVHLPVTKFSKNWIISFWWLLTMIFSDWQSQIFENKIWRPKFGPNGPKSDQNDFFLPFYWVWIVWFQR